MQFFVKSLTGKTLTVNVQAGDSISNVKSMIQEREGMSREEFKIGFAISAVTMILNCPPSRTVKAMASEEQLMHDTGLVYLESTRN